MTKHLSKDEVLRIHAVMIGVDYGGGASGLRDPGLLESAINRPRIGYYNDAIEEAAALWESVSQNHPFVDGNKRTAFACASMHLRLNGFELSAEYSAEAAAFVPGLYETGEFEFERLAEWLREHVNARDRGRGPGPER